MAELITDNGAAASEATVLMFLYRGLWSADKSTGELATKLEEDIEYSVDGEATRTIEELGVMDTQRKQTKLAQHVYAAYLARRGAQVELEGAEHHREERIEELENFYSTLVGKVMTVTTLEDVEEPAIQWHPFSWATNWVDDVEWPSQQIQKVSGVVSDRSTPSSLGGGQIVLSPTGFLRKHLFDGAYFIRPHGDDGQPLVTLSVES